MAISPIESPHHNFLTINIRKIMIKTKKTKKGVITLLTVKNVYVFILGVHHYFSPRFHHAHI